MEPKDRQQPARTPPSATRPEDLHAPEHAPPLMPESADTPDQPADQPDRRARPSVTGGRSPARPANVAPSATRPEDLHAPEHAPPLMPESADTPDQPADEPAA